MTLESWARANWIAIASVLIMAAFLAISWSLFGSGLENPRIAFREAPLIKNAGFQLQPGEQYVYAYLLNGTSANITYAVYPGQGCTYIVTVENVNGTPVCVGPDGTDSGGYNTTLSDPAVLIFKPWMLALENGWSWNSSMYLVFNGGDKHVSDTYYRVVRNDTYMNRSVFIVEVKSSGGPSDYEWIDAQKRILLRETGAGYEVRLIGGLPGAG